MQKSEPLNIIATRPNNRATNLIEALASLSSDKHLINAHHTALIDISDYQDEVFFARLNETNQSDLDNQLRFDGVIFISGNAVDWAQKSLQQQVWQSIINNPLFAIGEQTASVLQRELDRAKLNSSKLNRDSRFASKVIFPAQMNSEGLLSLPQLSQIKLQHWLIVKGLGGRDKLKTGLEAAGASVSELSVYQRKLPDSATQERIKALQQTRPLWLISSIEALNNLYQILNHQVEDCRIIVSSDRITQQARQLGFNIVAQAKDASDKQLLQCVMDCIGAQSKSNKA